MQKQIKRLNVILLAVPLLLMIPLLAMLFTNEVNWTITDFIAAGMLLLAAGMTFELIMRKVKTTRVRIVLCVVLFAAFFLVWAELAVGLFGTPFGGS